ncbi:microseminoprotein beta [Homo sapiens]|uniref:Beta-microseminoprotein n=1 Tax=Homo sapiens TaxID=9606 RepID=A0A590UJG9_HUMAN|nr:microseminoprotein beta [Homo sapiens]KAI4075842.1 microseminoprotein beta [Homo sapiens]
MNVLLGSVVIFATFVTLCNASCYFIPNEGVPGDSTRKCMDLKGNKHPINSEWQTDNCETCTCYETEISCCTLFVSMTVFLHLWVMTKTTAKESSRRRTASISWWRRRTQKRPVLSVNG